MPYRTSATARTREPRVESAIPFRRSNCRHAAIHTLWKCPDGSGSSYPVTLDVKVELHYDAGEDRPWTARWVHPTAGPGAVVSNQPVDAR